MSKKLFPVPMKTVWGCVAVAMRQRTGRTDITNLQYVADICKGNKKNAQLSPIARECCRQVTEDLRAMGQKPRYPI